ncbi:MAG: hypothetical protein DWQ37_11750 [Planctomycetota bacterium]|nr:MAG: hypothetical protein DWQ37_11750 [Planctomycetota bacterium]
MIRSPQAGMTTLLFLLLAAWSVAARAETPPAEDSQAETHKYIRIDRDEADEPLSLQTVIVRFVPADDSGGVSVDLVGAVHVGESSYYEALNKAFEDYDVVLYELVAPDGTRVEKGTKPSNHPVAMLQNGLKDMLELEHQLQCVDYTKDNMVHADMSPDAFAKSMEDRGESFFGMFFRMMGHAMAQQSAQKNPTSDFDLLSAFFDNDRSTALKRVMAEQFESLEGVMQALDGPDGSTIITERNKVALEKLREQLDAGKKKIAIFYGAGHLRDMEQRLSDDFKLKRDREQWLDAWNLGKPQKAKKPAREQKKAASIRPPVAPWHVAPLAAGLTR